MAEPVGFQSLCAYLYHFLQWVRGSGEDIEPPFQREAKTQDGVVLGSGHCSAHRAVLGAQGSAGAPAAAGLVFHAQPSVARSHGHRD